MKMLIYLAYEPSLRRVLELLRDLSIECECGDEVNLEKFRIVNGVRTMLRDVLRWGRRPIWCVCEV